MSESPPFYDLGVFASIVSVHFGGPWIAVSGVGTGDNAVQLSFPSIAGGTPALQIIGLDSSVIPGPSSKLVAAKDLAGTVTMPAGLGLTGFSMGNKFSGLFAGMVFLHCVGPLAKKFTLTTTCLYPPSRPPLATVMLFAHAQIAVGAKLSLSKQGSGSGNPPGTYYNGPVPNVALNNPNHGNVFQYIVDPANSSLQAGLIS